jgi:hypothetical protein
LSSDADQLAAGTGQGLYLPNGGFGIHRRGVGHGLNPDGMVPTNLQITDTYYSCAESAQLHHPVKITQ